MFNDRQIDTIITGTEDLGVKVPTLILKAQARVTKFRDVTEKFLLPPTALADAVLKAIDDNRDPATDEEVQRIVAAKALSNHDLVSMLTARVIDDYSAIVTTHANTLVKLWQEPFNRAADDINRAVDLLGNTPLTESEAILGKGGDAADAWVKATTGNRTISTILGLWTQLNNNVGFAPSNRLRQVLRYAEPTLEQYWANDLHDRKMSAWEAAQMGLTLSLADGPEFAARIAHIETAERDEVTRQQNTQTGRLGDRDKAFMTANMS